MTSSSRPANRIFDPAFWHDADEAVLRDWWSSGFNRTKTQAAGNTNKPIKQPIPEKRPDNSLLTIKEVAARLLVSRKQVRKFVDTGSLRYINVGRGSKYRAMRFAPADVDECLRELSKRESPAIKQPRQRIGRRNTEDEVVVGFTARRLLKEKRKHD
jgi:excisionase family DNA binding protein